MTLALAPHNLNAMAACACAGALALLDARPAGTPPLPDAPDALPALILPPGREADADLRLLRDYVRACLSEAPQAPLAERLRAVLGRLLSDPEEQRCPTPKDMYEGAWLALRRPDGEERLRQDGVPESWIRAYRVAARECLLEATGARPAASERARAKAAELY